MNIYTAIFIMCFCIVALSCTGFVKSDDDVLAWLLGSAIIAALIAGFFGAIYYIVTHL